MYQIKTLLLLATLSITLNAYSEDLNDKFFLNFKDNYCINNPYNCKFDGTVSGYSVADYLSQRYKFIELFYAENGFESAAFEYCGSRFFNPTVSLEHKQNRSMRNYGKGCIRFKFLKDKNIESLIEERRGLFQMPDPDKSIYSNPEVMPGYVLTIAHPNDYYDATGRGLNNLGVHFFIDLMNKNNLDRYCKNTSPINAKQLPSSLRKIINHNNPNDLFQNIKKDYNIFYRVYLKNIAQFIPSKSPKLVMECLFIRKSATSTAKMYIFNGRSIINETINKEKTI